MTVVLVGLAYYPCRSASDKNFMRDVALAVTREHGVDVLIVSIAENRGWRPEDGGRDEFADVYFIPRPFHPVRDDPSGTLAHPRHGRLREYAERSAAAVALTPLLRRLRDHRGARYVHFFDNLGPGAGLSARCAGLRCGTTILGSNSPRHRRSRRLFWRASMAGVHDVVAGSDALREELVADGVPVRDVIPWAPSRTLAPFGPPYDERTAVVWTGPLGSSGPAEARLAARAMAVAGERLPEMRPFLWPKPEYAHDYAAVAAESGVSVQTPGTDFIRMLGEARVLVSPVGDPTSIARPDLTWLEAVRLGATVVTTPCRGVDERLLRSGGVVVAREQSEVAVADAIVNAWSSSGPDPQDFWTAEDAAGDYARLWSLPTVR